jgi:intein-encoded DNA endonuclease-like protein
MKEKGKVSKKITEKRVREIVREEIIKWEKETFEPIHNPPK